MVEYPYPYVEPAKVIVANAISISVPLVALGWLLIEWRRPVVSLNGCLWLGYFACLPFPFFMVESLPSHSQFFLHELWLSSLAVTLVGIVVVTIRLVRQGKVLATIAMPGGVLVAIAIWASYSNSDEAVRQLLCTRNLKQIILAVHRYHDEFDELPVPVALANDEVGTSWRVLMGSYLEIGVLTERYDRSQSWDSPDNEDIAQTRARPYMCPANRFLRDSRNRYYTAYAVPVGPLCLFSESHRRTWRDVQSNRSATMAIVEACGRNIVWTKPEDVSALDLRPGVNRPGRTRHTSEGVASSMHPSGANAAFADGSIRYLHEDIDPNTLRELLSAL